MSTSPARILVVDDDATARLLMGACVRKAGFEVGLAEDGEKALRMFLEQPFDLVMLDEDMPGLPGHEVCMRLRAEAGDLLPIVMVTGMDDMDSIERAYQSGATDFIAKPINWALIGHRVRYLLRSFAAQRDLRIADARNAAMLSAMPDTLLRIDAQGIVLEARVPEEARAGRYWPVEGEPFAQGYPPDAARRLLEAVQHARERYRSTRRIFAQRR